jgi:hypothetical protein
VRRDFRPGAEHLAKKTVLRALPQLQPRRAIFSQCGYFDLRARNRFLVLPLKTRRFVLSCAGAAII